MTFRIASFLALLSTVH